MVGIPPTLAQPQLLPHILEGAGVTIPCQLVGGYPPIEYVSWFKDGQDIDIEPGIVSVGGDHSLTILSVQPHHAGEYTCLAHNSEGEDSITVSLQVVSKTVILSKPAHHQYRKGEQVMFDCQVEVDTREEGVTITWYKGETRLIADHHVRVLDNNSLLISEVQQGDLGYYSCEVATDLSPTVRSGHSQIYYPDTYPALIIIIISILIIIVILTLICFCITKCRRTLKGEGYYCVDDMEVNDKKVGSTTHDSDSIMQETDHHKTDMDITQHSAMFNPKSVHLLSRLEKAGGSIGSLLSDEEFLNRGMEEDGSFRQHYLHPFQ